MLKLIPKILTDMKTSQVCTSREKMGAGVGNLEGLEVGCVDGCIDGREEGSEEGCVVGMWEGCDEGRDVG